MRGYSEKRLREKMKEKGCESAVIDKTLETLRKWKLVDDAALAQSIMRNWANFRHASDRAIANKLLTAGLDPKLVKIETPEESEPESERALVLAQQKIKSLKRYEPAVAKQKLLMYLSGKGFDYGICREAVKQVLSVDDSEEM